ncbi:MAG: DUF2232 domain-containing protein [Calothrix sp. SM1_5_4]|nr:DUF2232 domain-containing protein [Calothrix sp. SM1_5_4]
MRRQLGRLGFWSLTLPLCAAVYAAQAWPLAIALFSLVLLTGIFAEMEEVGLSVTLSAFFTLLINALIGAGAFTLWMSSAGSKWSQVVLTGMESVLKPVIDLNPRLQVNLNDLMMQLPSVVIILWMVALYLSVLLESRLTGTDAESAAGKNEALKLKAQLADFRLPDPVIWVFIAALFGSFSGLVPRGLEIVSVNVLNICFMAFFLQGITVIGKFFEAVKMGVFWQFIFMVLIVVHLFMFVSLLGLMDFWLDLRARLTKRREQFNRET